jgi:phosphatidylglycerophosphatase A
MPMYTEKGRLDWPTWIASGFGIGFAPQAPGTLSTMIIALVYGSLPVLEPLYVAIAAVVLFAVGVPLCKHAEDQLGTHDPGAVVWDEFTGFAVAVLYLPQTWPVILGALLAFRIFDVFKPFPGGRAQRLPHGWGIMMDDIVAGVWANLAVRAALEFIF